MWPRQVLIILFLCFLRASVTHVVAPTTTSTGTSTTSTTTSSAPTTTLAAASLLFSGNYSLKNSTPIGYYDADTDGKYLYGCRNNYVDRFYVNYSTASAANNFAPSLNLVETKQLSGFGNARSCRVSIDNQSLLVATDHASARFMHFNISKSQPLTLINTYNWGTLGYAQQGRVAGSYFFATTALTSPAMIVKLAFTNSSVQNLDQFSISSGLATTEYLDGIAVDTEDSVATPTCVYVGSSGKPPTIFQINVNSSSAMSLRSSLRLSGVASSDYAASMVWRNNYLYVGIKNQVVKLTASLVLVLAVVDVTSTLPNIPGGYSTTYDSYGALIDASGNYVLVAVADGPSSNVSRIGIHTSDNKIYFEDVTTASGVLSSPNCGYSQSMLRLGDTYFMPCFSNPAMYIYQGAVRTTTSTTTTSTTSSTTTTSTTTTSTTTTTTTTTSQPTTTTTSSSTSAATTSSSTTASTTTSTSPTMTSTSTSTSSTTAMPTTSSTTTTTAIPTTATTTSTSTVTTATSQSSDMSTTSSTTSTSSPTNTTTSATSTTSTTTTKPSTSTTTTSATATSTTTPKPTTTTTKRPRTKTQTLFTNPPPTFAPPLAVAQLAAVATTSTVASTIAAPAAAQTLRSMSVLGVIDTAERCELSKDERSTKDVFASSDREFPESFLPFIKISFGNQTTEQRFGLASRRGAIIANAFIAPLFVFGIAIFVGFIRTKTSKKMAKLGIVSAGRTPSIVASMIGALMMDGIFCSAIVLMTVPDGPEGADVALSIFGIIVSSAIVIVPGIFLARAMMQRENEKVDQIRCVPSVFISTTTAAASNDNSNEAISPPATSKIDGIFHFLFGDEIWIGDAEILETYRNLFANNRGYNIHRLNSGGKDSNNTRSRKNGDSWPRVKKFRRDISTWSFYVDVVMTILAAAGRGWATTLPCVANKKVQLLQFIVALLSFAFTVAVQPAISPLRRSADMFANFLLVLSTFILAILGAESGAVVGKCALAAAFVATGSALLLFCCRRGILPVLKKRIVADQKYCSVDNNNNSDNVDLSDWLGLPLLLLNDVGDVQATTGNNNNNNNNEDPSLEQELETFFSNHNDNNNDASDLELMLGFDLITSGDTNNENHTDKNNIISSGLVNDDVWS